MVSMLWNNNCTDNRGNEHELHGSDSETETRDKADLEPLRKATSRERPPQPAAAAHEATVWVRSEA